MNGRKSIRKYPVRSACSCLANPPSKKHSSAALMVCQPYRCLHIDPLPELPLPTERIDHQPEEPTLQIHVIILTLVPIVHPAPSQRDIPQIRYKGRRHTNPQHLHQLKRTDQSRLTTYLAGLTH